MTAARDVPVMRCCSVWVQMACKGAMTKPPPTPSNPLASPAIPPIAALTPRAGLGALVRIGLSTEPADVEVDDLIVLQKVAPRPFQPVAAEDQNISPLGV